MLSTIALRRGHGPAPCQAELLRLGGAEVKLQYLELFDDQIGPAG